MARAFELSLMDVFLHAARALRLEQTAKVTRREGDAASDVGDAGGLPEAKSMSWSARSSAG